MGRILSQLRKDNLKKIGINLNGELLSGSLKLLSAALLKGFLSEEIDQPVNLVNANILSEERGITLEESLSTQHRDYQNLIEASIKTDSENWKFSGTVFGDNEIRIIKINNFPVEFKPEGNILIYRNIDKPGMLASVSRELSLSNINIASLSLGRLTEGDEALTVVNLDSAIDERIKKSILAIEGIKAIYSVSI